LNKLGDFKMTRALKVHGQVATGAFYGYTPLVLKVTDSDSAAFTADTVDATTGAITKGGYSKAVEAMQSLGSIIWLGARTDAHYFTCIVDGPSFNAGGGAITSGAYGALKDAMVLSNITTVDKLSVNAYTTLANTAAFTA